jgi:hypothetical protein
VSGFVDNSDPSNVVPTQGTNVPSTTPQMLASSTMTTVGWTLPASMTPNTQSSPISYAQSRVEYPTLSALPPLRSLSVLDIDELDYLDEMSVLIAKSQDRLRELRVGVSAKAVNRDFALSWDGPTLHQVDHHAQWPGASKIGERRLGGVLGVLLGRVYDIRKKPKLKTEKKELSASISSISETPALVQQIQPEPDMGLPAQHNEALLSHIPEVLEGSPEEDWTGKDNGPLTEAVLAAPGVTFNINDSSSNAANGMELDAQDPLASSSLQSDVDALSALISTHQISSENETPNTLPQESSSEPLLRRSQSQTKRQSHFSEAQGSERARLEGKLQLQTLELERVALSVVVLQKAFDWSVLTNLTILDCAQHDRLWVMLRKTFAPTTTGHGHHSSRHGAGTSIQYHLNLKKIHTDAASPALISFLKETLAPNTLETLFLQDRKRSNNSNVTIVSQVCSTTFRG